MAGGAWDPSGTTPPRINPQPEQVIAASPFAVEQRPHVQPLAMPGSSLTGRVVGEVQRPDPGVSSLGPFGFWAQGRQAMARGPG